MAKDIDEADPVHHQRTLPGRTPARLATALIPVLTSVHDFASFAAECCERGQALARNLRDTVRAAVSVAGASAPARPKSRRTPVRRVASSVVEFSELDRQRARSALARADLHPVKRSP
jgi:hypothetical protein